MSNLLKRVLSLVVALVMVLGLLPVTSLAAETGSADISTLNGGANKTTYATYTTENGWTAKNAQAYLKDGVMYAVLNGKTSAVGSLTSPTLTGGIQDLTISYTNCYSDSNGVDITITVTGSNGSATYQLDDDSVTQMVIETVTWTLDAAIEGDFIIVITNNSPTNSTSNKDRVGITALSWTGYENSEAEDCTHANTEEVAEVPATCTTAGYTAGVQCTDCGVYTEGHEVVAALGHSYDDGVATTEATCTANGVLTKTCTVCGNESASTIYAIAHTYVDGVCSVCGRPEPVQPVPGTAYKWFIEQITKEQMLYFTGAMNGYYGATSENVEDSVDMYVEETDGGYYLYFMNGETKNYINIVASGTYINFKIEETASSVYVYNETHKTLVTTVNGTEYYLGTYGTYVTYSASKLSFLPSNTSFASHFYAVTSEEVCEHEYMYACDQTCAICGELTNPDATHTLVHVDAVAPTVDATGNIEYWYCSDCGSAWTDEACTQVTNQMSVKLPALEAVAYKTDGTKYATLAEAVAVGGDIYLCADVTLTEALVIDKYVILSATEEYTITTDVTDAIQVVEGGTLTLGANVTVLGTDAILWGNGGNIVIDGATVKLDNAECTHNAVYMGSGVLTVNSGLITANNAYTTISLSGAEMVINGGEVASENCTVITAKNGADVTMTNGTVTGDETYVAFYSVSDGTVSISGGNVAGKLAAVGTGTVTVTGGTYTVDVSEYCADGYIVTENDGVYTVSACEHEYDNACDVDCNICGENREVEHNVVAVEAKAATCTEEGNIAYWYCDVCGAAWLDAECTLNTNLKAVVLPMAEHEYDNACDVDCNVCGETREVEHNVVAVEAKAPTCTAEGNIAYWYCDVCGAAWLDAECTLNTNLKAVVLPMAEHEYFYACDQYCMNCYELTNPNATHTIVHVDAVAPTVDATGNIEYWYCSDCGTCWDNAECTGMPLNQQSVKLPALEAVAQIWTEDDGAFVRGDKYATLEEAIAAATENDFVRVIANIETDAAIVIDKAVDLDLNGFTISATENDTVGDGVFYVVSGGDLTIIETDAPGTINGVGGNDYCMAIWADGGKVTIYGGTYTNVGAGEDDHYDLIYVKNGGEVVIYGGTFICETPDWTLNSNDIAKGTITVYGGTFYGFDPDNCATEGAGTNFCADGYHAYEDGENYIVHKAVYVNTCDAHCAECGELTNPDAAHTVEHVAAVAATCTENGNIEYWYCTICGSAWADEAQTQVTNSKNVIVPATGHSYFYACDAHCMNCGELTNPDAAHTITHVEAKAGTDCQTWDGNVEYWTCSDCGGVWLDEALTQQTSRFGIVCTGEHSYFYPCDKVCQVCYEETNPDATHTVVHVDAVAATCTENGNIEYWYCSDCGSAWSDEAQTQVTNLMSVVVPAAHTYTDNCDEVCDVCEMGYRDAPHNLTTHVEAKVPAHCQEQGYNEHWICEDCGNYFVYNEWWDVYSSIDPMWLYYYGEHSYVCGACEFCGLANDTITVYLENNWLCTDVRAHIWYKVDGADTTVVDWPGVELELYGYNASNGYEIYVLELPADAYGVVFNGLKNDDSGNRNQTSDIIGGWYDGIIYYMAYNDGLSYGSYDMSVFVAKDSKGNLYTTLDEALEVGGEITLLTDVTTDAAFVIDNTVVLDTGYYSISTTENDTVGDGVFHVVSGGDLTLNGYGTINGVGGNDYCMAIWADGGKVTINSGNFTNLGAGEDDHYDLIYVKNGGEVVINGGWFEAQTPAWTLNSHDTLTGTITVYGGDFVGFNPADCTTEGAGTNWVAQCHVSEKPDWSDTWSVSSAHTYDNACDVDCNVCGETREVEHWIIPVDAVEPTCTAYGNIAYWYCEVCGLAWLDEACTLNTNLKAVVLPMAEHEYDNACDVDCNVCGETREVEHTVVAVEAKAATCTEEGNIAYWYCEVCGLAWLDEACTLNTNLKAVVLPMAEHEYFYACDTHCMNCGELTNPDAAHTITYVEAKAGTDCETWDGNVEYWTCSDCGGVWLDADLRIQTTRYGTFTNGDHIYENGTCTVCGEADPNALFDIDGANMTLGNSLAMNFYILPSDLVEGETYYAVITKEYADGRDAVTVTVEQADWTWHEVYQEWYVSFNGVAAKEMTDTITVVVYNSADEQVSNVWVDSVQAYTMRVLLKEEAKASPNAEKLTLYVDMLNYGAAAQVEFEYNTENLANNQLTEAQAAYATSDDIELTDNRVKGEGYSATSLTLESDITMNFFFLASAIPTEHDDYYAIATWTDHYGNAKEVRVEGEDFAQLTNDTDWYVPVKGVVVADARQLVTVTVYNAAGEAVATGADSIESYVARNMSKKPIYLAIMKFCVSAYESFH